MEEGVGLIKLFECVSVKSVMNQLISLKVNSNARRILIDVMNHDYQTHVASYSEDNLMNHHYLTHRSDKINLRLLWSEVCHEIVVVD